MLKINWESRNRKKNCNQTHNNLKNYHELMIPAGFVNKYSVHAHWKDTLW